MSAADRVLAALAGEAGATGECSPSVAQVMARTGLSDRWVQRAISDLARDGRLRRVMVPGRKTVYFLQQFTPEVTPEAAAPPKSSKPLEISGFTPELTPEVTPALMAPPKSAVNLEIAGVARRPSQKLDKKGGGYILQSSFLLPIEGKEERSKGKPREVEPAGFEAWWRAYPRKVGKLDAMRCYERALKRGATPGSLMTGLLRYPFSEEAVFRPHPATWLNQGRWMDEPDSRPNVVQLRPVAHGPAAEIVIVDGREIDLSQVRNGFLKIGLRDRAREQASTIDEDAPFLEINHGD